MIWQIFKFYYSSITLLSHVFKYANWINMFCWVSPMWCCDMEWLCCRLRGVGNVTPVHSPDLDSDKQWPDKTGIYSNRTRAWSRAAKQTRCMANTWVIILSWDQMFIFTPHRLKVNAQFLKIWFKKWLFSDGKWRAGLLGGTHQGSNFDGSSLAAAMLLLLRP